MREKPAEPRSGQEPSGAAPPSLGDLIEHALSRRTLIQGLAVATGGALLAPALHAATGAPPTGRPSFRFKELGAGVDARHHVAEGYEADILIRWGDPIHSSAPEFDPARQTAATQKQQFGFNNDFLGFIPLGRGGDRGLLCVHHEYSESALMFPGLGNDPAKAAAATTAEQVAVEMAALGGSIVEIARRNGRWSVVRGSRYNRRITALDTQMAIDGAAAGHPRLRTAADPTGTRVIGTHSNCAGGITPWGTWLMSEENVQSYFGGRLPANLSKREADSFKRYGIPGSRNNWSKHVDRYDVGKEPNEAYRWGWIVEVDPLDPTSMPVKHTALGRFRHEGAENAVTRDGRIAVYSGDDDRNEFAYKFVSRSRYQPRNRAANMRLLSEGTLYVARFEADGTGKWLPLVHGQGPLTADNGFASQADVLIDTRLAATAVGATPMDRPEDFEPGPDGRVILALTNNETRKAADVDKANPRGPNPHGHIIEIIEDGQDPGATTFKWSILVLCGDPGKPEHGASWHAAQSADGWFSAPDNVSFDPAGRLWVATDQGSNWTKLTGRADGLFALEHKGRLRGLSKLFFRCPVGAEMCGPRFTPDGATLFLAVQHPAADGVSAWPPFGKRSSFDEPATRWPDFKAGVPARPSVLVVTRTGGGRIGG